MNIVDASNTGNITLNVTDNANRIVQEITGALNSQGDLDEVNTLIVSGGNVDVASADAIQISQDMMEHRATMIFLIQQLQLSQEKMMY